jgi:hypothetical protein
MRLDKFIDKCFIKNQNWDGHLISVSDDLKEEICLMWLTEHMSWCEDVFAAYEHESCETLLLDLYDKRDGRFASKTVINAALRYVTGDLPMQDYEDDCFYSVALDYFKKELYTMSPLDFDEWYRGGIYLYLEIRLSELVMDAYIKAVSPEELY